MVAAFLVHFNVAIVAYILTRKKQFRCIAFYIIWPEAVGVKICIWWCLLCQRMVQVASWTDTLLWKINNVYTLSIQWCPFVVILIYSFVFKMFIKCMKCQKYTFKFLKVLLSSNIQHHWWIIVVCIYAAYYQKLFTFGSN